MCQPIIELYTVESVSFTNDVNICVFFGKLKLGPNSTLYKKIFSSKEK